MGEVIRNPSVIEAAGSKPKLIEEYVGRVNSSTEEVSIAKMVSPQGWEEPGQRPEFNEYTVVLKGALLVRTKQTEEWIREGMAYVAKAGEWVQYCSPEEGGAEYIAVCLPAFSPQTVHRDASQ